MLHFESMVTTQDHFVASNRFNTTYNATRQIEKEKINIRDESLGEREGKNWRFKSECNVEGHI